MLRHSNDRARHWAGFTKTGATGQFPFLWGNNGTPSEVLHAVRGHIRLNETNLGNAVADWCNAGLRFSHYCLKQDKQDKDKQLQQSLEGGDVLLQMLICIYRLFQFLSWRTDFLDLHLLHSCIPHHVNTDLGVSGGYEHTWDPTLHTPNRNGSSTRNSNKQTSSELTTHSSFWGNPTCQTVQVNVKRVSRNTMLPCCWSSHTHCTTLQLKCIRFYIQGDSFLQGR